MNQQKKYYSDPNIQIVNGGCPHNCPDACGWQVAVEKESGRAVDIWGNPSHPVTQGMLCGKVDRYLERSYHQDRLMTPLRRVGPKGAGQFEPISWAEAIGEIGERLQQVIGDYGPEAVLPYSFSGAMGLLQKEGMAFRFFNRMGASRLARTICSMAGMEGHTYTTGTVQSMEMEAFAQSKLILIWGSNTLTSNVHLWPFVQAARKQGARVVVIDPARTRTARAADEWIAIRPDTDSALALGMMHLIINEGLYDADYVEKHTLGFEQLRERVQAWPPERVAEVTGVPAEQLCQLARDYASTRPAAIRMNYGLQRTTNGGMAVRTIACLPALVGAWREVGGGLQLSTSGTFSSMNTKILYRSDLLHKHHPGHYPRMLNMIRLGDALSLDPADIAQAYHHPTPNSPKATPQEAGPPVKALIVYNCNPAAVTPDQTAVLRGLQREDLFTVVLEQFPTDTADYADYVLPATTQLEHWDLLTSYGHLYMNLNRPAIAPIGESLPNSEIFRRLAVALGYEDSCFQESDETILRTLIEDQTDPAFETISWDQLLEQGFARLNLPAPYLPFAQGNFPTPSGKCEFYSEQMARDGYDPLPTYEGGSSEPQHIKGKQAADLAPLTCISPPAHSFLNSSFVNVKRFKHREKSPTLQIHPHDAQRRAIDDGEMVRLWNDLGSVNLKAKVTDGVVQGTVLAPGIWWNKYSLDHANINQITSQTETDMGGSPTFYAAKVWVGVV